MALDLDPGEVVVNEGLLLEDLPAHATRPGEDGEAHQVLTGYLLNRVLEAKFPEGAAAFVGLTSEDLWPGRGWNFLFGPT